MLESLFTYNTQDTKRSWQISHEPRNIVRVAAGVIIST